MLFDFNKRLGKKAPGELPTDPRVLFEKLDRASDTSPLRTPQHAVLTEWYEKRRDAKELILKLHTGQGKTLVGLLILQSQLNAGRGPALYLCPNKVLAAQTVKEAGRFGLEVVEADRAIPDAFTESKAILVTHVKKLFNGETKFGLGAKSTPLGTVLLDDAHACVDIIQETFTINLKHDQGAYGTLRDLFATELKEQGLGTYAELIRHAYDAILPVPYWAWQDKLDEVAKILVEHVQTNEIRFVWPLLKDILHNCTCLFSGESLEIRPTLPPLDVFGSYAKASHRIFMSATVANDAFLVKGLGMDVTTVQTPIAFKEERWSGEKMILIPSLIDEELDRSYVVNKLGPPVKGRQGGVVVLAPSYARTADWEKLGAAIARKDVITSMIERLRRGDPGDRDAAVVFASRYDGIDLPDWSCRILILDSCPFTESLQDRYLQRCLGNSDAIAAAIARKIEQGLGRAVRGEKDWAVILIIGPDLVRHVRSPQTQRLLSAQTQRQMEIGSELIDMARELLTTGAKPEKTLEKAIDLGMDRDQGWKDFYTTKMNEMSTTVEEQGMLDVFVAERNAELAFQRGDIDSARKIAQHLADSADANEALRGWYLQEVARYEHRRSRVNANTLQVAAHNRNRYLLRPASGMQFKKIAIISQHRIENLRQWIRSLGSAATMLVEVEAILTNLNFGVLYEEFEAALNDLGRALGFVCERPEKEWKEGPDNLWALDDAKYLLFECKSEVKTTRAEIAKSETDQINRAGDWFEKNYGKAAVTRILIIPSKKVGPEAALVRETQIMTQAKLDLLRKSVRAFFKEFSNLNLNDLDDTAIQQMIMSHKLDANHFATLYGERPQ